LERFSVSSTVCGDLAVKIPIFLYFDRKIFAKAVEETGKMCYTISKASKLFSKVFWRF
jgi:hypothetical protein